VSDRDLVDDVRGVRRVLGAGRARVERDLDACHARRLGVVERRGEDLVGPQHGRVAGLLVGEVLEEGDDRAVRLHHARGAFEQHLLGRRPAVVVRPVGVRGGLHDGLGDLPGGRVERDRALERRHAQVAAPEVGVERDRVGVRDVAADDRRRRQVQADLGAQLLGHAVHREPAALHGVGLGHHPAGEPQRALEQAHRGREDDEADGDGDQDLGERHAVLGAQAADHGAVIPQRSLLLLIETMVSVGAPFWSLTV
jgi:hypothetical protein